LGDFGGGALAERHPVGVGEDAAQDGSLGAGLTRTSGADSSIVDQDVEPIHRRLGRVGEATHLGECREVGREEIRRAGAGLEVAQHIDERLIILPATGRIALPVISRTASLACSGPRSM
jgi:hypothetical protein